VTHPKRRADRESAARTFVAGATYGFLAGALTVAAIAWQLSTAGAPRAASPGDPRASRDAAGAGDAVGTTGEPAPVVTPAPLEPVIGSPRAKELEDRELLVPVQGVRPDDLTRSFADARGSRRHEAIDIVAPRHTPVVAVEDGRIARLFNSKAGGITVYQFDPTGRFCYYYAHLERYADGLVEGDPVRKGQVIGYVGVSGNAPEDTPHLHFAVFRLTEARRWWEGTPLDPYDVLR
jgi:murein DD-endopeptidase MepM/ murein hydrolase activator NlpD